MERFFKKPNGVVIQAHKYHNMEDLKARFVECDMEGKELKKAKPKAKPKAKKKAEVE
tara:strand:- start:6019 stop:6189 length:171 start_codon:yes stop_codon:yes gene_type:complete